MPEGGGQVLSSTEVENDTGLSNTCMNGIYQGEDDKKDSLECTAEDIKIAATSDLVVTDGCSGQEDDTATISFVAEFALTAKERRYDVGVYIAEDGGDALNGQCTIADFPFKPDPPWLSLDGGEDTCGDIDSSHSPLYSSIQNVTVACVDTNGDGYVDIDTCLSWREPGSNELCTAPYDAYPGAPSKCKCQQLPGISIPISPDTPALGIEKSADPKNYNGTGETITYSYKLTNAGNDTLYQPFTVSDDRLGTVSCPDTPASLAPTESITCTTTHVTTQADVDAGSIVNVAHGTGKDAESDGNDVTSPDVSATVTGPSAAPALTAVPALSPFGLLILTALFGLIGAAGSWLRSRR